jgi:hypothetical protein
MVHVSWEAVDNIKSPLGPVNVTWLPLVDIVQVPTHVGLTPRLEVPVPVALKVSTPGRSFVAVQEKVLTPSKFAAAFLQTFIWMFAKVASVVCTDEL